jgi:hypothetical protein
LGWSEAEEVGVIVDEGGVGFEEGEPSLVLVDRLRGRGGGLGV